MKPNERFRYVTAIIVLSAALVASVATLINKYDVTKSMIIILITVVVSLIVGTIVKSLFVHFLVVEEEKSEEGENSEEDGSKEDDSKEQEPSSDNLENQDEQLS